LPKDLFRKMKYGYAPHRRHSGIGFRVVREKVTY